MNQVSDVVDQIASKPSKKKIQCIRRLGQWSVCRRRRRHKTGDVSDFVYCLFVRLCSVRACIYARQKKDQCTTITRMFLILLFLGFKQERNGQHKYAIYLWCVRRTCICRVYVRFENKNKWMEGILVVKLLLENEQAKKNVMHTTQHMGVLWKCRCRCHTKIINKSTVIDIFERASKNILY